MDVNNILNELEERRVNKINNNDLEGLDINTMFKLETEIIEDINQLQEKYKNLYLIYFNYNKMKNKIKNKIEDKKKLLVKISMQKEEFNKIETKKKAIFLSKEYSFYKEQTNTKKLIEKIKSLCNKIDLLKGNMKNRKLTLEYNKIKEKYREIMIFVSSEKFDGKNETIPSNLTNEEKIEWLNKRIEEYIEKQMIFDNYIYLLENYYNEILDKKISNISLSKESV